MKLQEWIDNKVTELKTQNKYREVIFKQTKMVKMSRNMMQESYDFTGEDTNIPLDVEVKDINRDDLPITHNSDEYVDAIKITLEVLKPRKRKFISEYYYVKLV